MSDIYPYRVEYSKDPRSYCRLCRKKIVIDALRIAAMVQVRYKQRINFFKKLIF